MSCANESGRGRAAGVEGRTDAEVRCANRSETAPRVRAALCLARGGNPYRAKAYSRAADSLAALAAPLDKLIMESRLTEIPGVGEAIADIVTKLYRTGTHPSLEKLRKEVPAGVLALLAVPGLRPDKVMRLDKDLGISSLAELEVAAQADRIKKAKGLGAALQTKILQNLVIARSGAGRLHIHSAAALLEDWRWHQAALDFGCVMSINPDALSIRELDHMH